MNARRPFTQVSSTCVCALFCSAITLLALGVEAGPTRTYDRFTDQTQFMGTPVVAKISPSGIVDWQIVAAWAQTFHGERATPSDAHAIGLGLTYVGHEGKFADQKAGLKLYLIVDGDRLSLPVDQFLARPPDENGTLHETSVVSFPPELCKKIRGAKKVEMRLGDVELDAPPVVDALRDFLAPVATSQPAAGPDSGQG